MCDLCWLAYCRAAASITELLTLALTAGGAAGTPADNLLALLNDILEGRSPPFTTILAMRAAILNGRDIYKPLRVGSDLLQSKGMDVSAAHEGVFMCMTM